MKYEKLGSNFKPILVKEINQKELSSECWLIQFTGLKACEKCEFLNKSDCGGKRIREKLVNERGFIVPLGGEI